MKKLILILSMFMIVGLSNAQVPGYLGHRIFVNIHGGISPDLHIRDEIDGNSAISKTVVSLKCPISMDANIIISNWASLGVGVRKANMKAQFANVYNDNISLSNTYTADVVYSTTTLQFYMEFHPEISYSIMDDYFRVGFAIGSYSNKKYTKSYFSPNYNSNYYTQDIPDDFIALKLGQRSNSFGLYYGLGTRIPIGKNMLINYGLYGYFFGRGLSNYDYFDYTEINNTESDTFIEDLGTFRMRFSNLLNFHLGMTFVF